MENRRDFARVDARLPFRECLEEVSSVSDLVPGMSEIFSAGLPPRPSQAYPDPIMVEWIDYLDAKINILANLLNTVTGTGAMPLTDINISGSGVAFETCRKVQLGDVEELHVSFDGRRIYRLYGEIMWTRNLDGNKSHVGARFLNMSDDIACEIDNFVLSREIEILSFNRHNGHSCSTA